MKGCSVEGCERHHTALGLCAQHYARSREIGSTRGDIAIGAAKPHSLRERQSPPCPLCGDDTFVCCYRAVNGVPVSWRCVSCHEEFVLST